MGAFTISLEAAAANATTTRGFFNSTNATRLAMISPDVINLFSDYYYNNSTVAGEGIKLKIEGVQPNTDYDLKLWTYDNDNNSITPTTWTPIEGTTGDVGSILNDRDDPWPQTLDDHSDVIRIRSTTNTLTLMGTTPGAPANGGTRLNALDLSLASTIAAGDYNGDGKVNAADYVLWRKNPQRMAGRAATTPGGRISATRQAAALAPNRTSARAGAIVHGASAGLCYCGLRTVRLNRPCSRRLG